MNRIQTSIVNGKDGIRAFLKSLYPSLAPMDEIELERMERFKSVGIEFPPHGLLFLEKPPKITDEALRLFGFMAGRGREARVENELHRLYFRTDIFDILTDKRIYDGFCAVNNLPKTALESNLDRSLVLSVRWDDMLMASNYATFTSCIAIPFEGYKEYCGGGRMYAQSLNTMVLYWVKNFDATGFSGDGHDYKECKWPKGPKMTGRRFGVITTKSYGLLREYGTLKVGVFPAMELFAAKTRLKLSAHFEPEAEKKVVYAKYLDKLGKHLSEFHPLDMELSEKYEAWGVRLCSVGESQEFRPCEKCGKRGGGRTVRTYFSAGKEIVEEMCDACYEERTFHCPKCSQRTDAKEKTYFAGIDICVSCEKTSVASCSCGNRVWASEAIQTTEGLKCSVCAAPYRKCESCGACRLKTEMTNYGRKWYCEAHDPLLACDCGSRIVDKALKHNKFSGPVGYCDKHPKVGFAYFDSENFADKWTTSKILETKVFAGNMFVRCAEGWVHFASGLLATENKDFAKFEETWNAAGAGATMDNLPVLNEVVGVEYYDK